MTLTKKQLSDEAFHESYLYDFYATKIFADEEFKEYLMLVISKILKRDIEEIKKDFKYLNVRLGLSRMNVDSEADVVVKTGIGYVSLEINWTMTKKTIRKNMGYVCSLYLSQLETSEDYGKLKDIFQINFNREDLFKEGEFVYTSRLYDDKSKKARKHNILQIIDVNMEYLKKMSYTTIKEMEERSLERLLYIFVEHDPERLNELYEGDELMRKVKNKFFYLESSLERFLLYDKQALRESNLKEEFQRIGLEEGREEEREANHKKMLEAAKKLYEAGNSLDVIAECLGLTEEAQEELKKSIRES